jgi:peptidoglycan LD-endopeptidase LytH
MAEKANQQRSLRLAVALACALSLVFGLVSSPGQATAQSTQERLNEARNRASQVRSEVARIADAYTATNAELDRTRIRHEEARESILRAEADIMDLQDHLKDRVRAAYRMRGVGFFQFLLDADSFQDFNMRLASLQRQTLADEDLILQLRRKRAEIESKRRELERQEEVGKGQLAELQRQGNQLTITLTEANALVQRLEGQLAQEEIRNLFSVTASRGGGGGGRTVPLSACPVAQPNFVTNSFGDPRSGGRRHQGNDIMAARGVGIYAVNDGTITSTRSGGLGGLAVYLWDGANRYYYAHLDRISVSSGQSVSAGQRLGDNGDTGNARGGPPHLHFEIHPGGGRAIDPYPSLSRVC